MENHWIFWIYNHNATTSNYRVFVKREESLYDDADASENHHFTTNSTYFRSHFDTQPTGKSLDTSLDN